MPLSHLDLLNVALAWRFTQPGWPACLARCEYLVHGIGVTIPLSDRSKISPDVLAGKASVTLIIEVKSGRNLDLGQLGRMESCTPEELRDYAHLHVPDPATHGVGIVYVCNDEHVERIAESCEDRATIVGFDGSSFSISGAPLPDVDLTTELQSCSVDPEALPLAIVPFDQESRLPDVAAVVLPEVVAALVRGAGQVSAEGILQRTHAICHDVMKSTGAGSEQRSILRRVAEVLKAAVAGEFRDWIERLPGQPVYRFRAALALDQAARTRELKALQKAATEMIKRLGGSFQLPLELEDL